MCKLILGAIKSILLMSLFLISSQINSQVNSVKYQLKYNIDSCWYDAFLIIDSGSSLDLQDRIQDYTQYTIVVPAGTNIWVIKNYLPLLDNESYTGAEPATWEINSVINAPEIMPESDFYIFSPNIDEIATYNDLNPGDTIKLFSVYIDHIANCGQNIRIFQNGVDPGPLESGMGFLDCSNDFNLNGSSHVYISNASQVNPPKPAFSNNTSVTCNIGIEIDITLNTSNCQLPVSFQWQGPNNYSSTSEDILITPVSYIHTGDYKIIVTNQFGCQDSLLIYAENKPSVGDDLLICPDTQVILYGNHPKSGIWTQNQQNLLGSSINILGQGMAEVNFDNSAFGIYEFIYVVNTCSDTMSIIVNNNTSISENNIDPLCTGQFRSFQPSEGGFWTSSDTMIAKINNNGIVNSLAAGLVSITYTDVASGCSSQALELSILPIPTLTLDGPPEVCIGSTTIIRSSSMGYWTGWDPSVISVNDTGLIEGILAGTTDLIFIDNNTGCKSDIYQLVINDTPIVEISGPDLICKNDYTQLSPSAGGVWISNNSAVATVDSSGTVLGINTGQSLFTWTQTSTGCSAETSSPVIVNTTPNVNLSIDEICIGSITSLTPNIGGTWMSNSPTIANVGFSSGIVSGLSEGNVTFTFTNSQDGCTATTEALTILSPPDLSIDMPNICIGSFTMLHPSSSGTWTSLDNEIAFVFGNFVVGTGSGVVQLLYTDDLTGCQNIISLSVTDRVTINIIGESEICEGSETELSPSNGGTWYSSNSSVATITNDGIVTGISEGLVSFTFTEITTGCNSLPSEIIVINPIPEIALNGSDTICIGESSLFSSTINGKWTSLNPEIASIDSINGIVNGNSSGQASFVVTSIMGCTSLPSPPLLVLPKTTPDLPIIKETCVGEKLNLPPLTNGFWTSQNTSIAEITPDGHVTTLAVGWTTFIFTDTFNRCLYTIKTDTLKVISCFRADINLTTTNTLTSGLLSTNDENKVAVNYGSTYTIISKPIGNGDTLTINENGSYTFRAESAGLYIYDISICVPPNTTGCTSSRLIITVVDPMKKNKTVMANSDYATTFVNTPIAISTLHNDVCIVVGGCKLEKSSISFIKQPKNGSINYNALNGNINYTPDIGFLGLDTLIYEVCCSSEPDNCTQAKQIINIVPTKSLNTTISTDDVFIGSYGEIVLGNILTNDIDPENDIQFVTPKIISNEKGSFVLDQLGNFTFTPSKNFIGPVSIAYQICDNNFTQACSNATLYLLILPNLQLNLRAYLEGALIENGNNYSNGRPLMRDNLRFSPFTGERYIPDFDPYQFENTYFNIKSKYNHIGCGDYTRFSSITSPDSVFTIVGTNAIVDWVFVELRSKINNKSIVATRSGLIQRDGDIVDIDGISPLRFPDVLLDDYYIVIRHRNHLGVMTLNPIPFEQFQVLIDFTSISFPTFDFGTTKNIGIDYTGLAQNGSLIPGYKALWAGDFDANNKIKASNPNDDVNNLFYDIFIFPENRAGNANFDRAFGYFQTDYDMNSKSKFVNPNDDRNFVLAQVLFYPQNIQFLPNFDFFIGQIP